MPFFLLIRNISPLRVDKFIKKSLLYSRFKYINNKLEREYEYTKEKSILFYSD